MNVFNDNEFKELSNSIRKNIIEGIQLSNIEFDYKKFELKSYHKVITNDKDHLKVINHTKNLRVSDFEIDFDSLAAKFSENVNAPLTPYIKELKRSHIQIRINRPNSLDINPPHRDGYLSYWKNILNVWIPIEGCNEKSSLPIIPKSHLIPELKIFRTKSKGAYINGNNYYVPCILKTTEGDLKMIRPNPVKGEALIFSPFLIHGAAFNFNEDTTRIAIELRFDKK